MAETVEEKVTRLEDGVRQVTARMRDLESQAMALQERLSTFERKAAEVDTTLKGFRGRRQNPTQKRLERIEREVFPADPPPQPDPAVTPPPPERGGPVG